MRKFYLVVAAGAGLLLAMGASAEAGGGRTPGAAFTPPGFSQGQKNGNWGTNPTGTPQPPGWDRNVTGQTNGWNTTLTNSIPPGLQSH